MYGHILVATDGSDRSERAAEEGMQLARAHDARVTVVTVVQQIDTGPLDEPGLDSVEQALEGAERQHGWSRIEETLSNVETDDVAVTGEIVAGQTHQAICEYVAENGVDLVVMGAASDDGLVTNVFSSTTERVTQHCDVPVLVV